MPVYVSPSVCLFRVTNDLFSIDGGRGSMHQLFPQYWVIIISYHYMVTSTSYGIICIPHFTLLYAVQTVNFTAEYRYNLLYFVFYTDWYVVCLMMNYERWRHWRCNVLIVKLNIDIVHLFGYNKMVY